MAVSLGLLTAFGGATSANAWLVKLERCEYPAARPGSAAIIYPREGLPAVVKPGEMLRPLVVVPRALSPKPGIQQPWARRGWSALLIGIAHGSAGPTEFRYPLEVANIRPEAGDTFVYRAHIPIPAYVAPGTYSLRMTVPHRREPLFTHASIRVVSGAPRLGSFAHEDADLDALRRSLQRLAHAPVDVVLVQRGSPLATAARSLAMESEAPALLEVPVAARVQLGTSDRRLGRCGQRQWDDEPEASVLTLDNGGRVELPTEMPAGLRFPEGDSEWRILVRPGEAVREQGLTFYPAMPVPSRGFTRGAVATLDDSTPRALHLTPPTPLSLELKSVRAIVGEPFELRAEASPGSLVAWRTTSGETHLGTLAQGRLDKRGDHRVYATAIGRDGALLERSAVVRVDLRNQGCAVAGQTAGVDWQSVEGQRGHTGLLPTFWALGIVLLIYRRSARE